MKWEVSNGIIIFIKFKLQKKIGISSKNLEFNIAYIIHCNIDTRYMLV